MRCTASVLVEHEVLRVWNLHLVKLDSRSLQHSVHVRILHMVDLVGGLGGQDCDSFQNRDDQLRVQTSLQESVESGLLYQFLKLIKLHTLLPPAGPWHPNVVQFDPQKSISHPAHRHDEPEEADNPEVPILDVASRSDVWVTGFIKAVRRLREVADGPGEESQQDHELKIPLLDLLLDILIHAFFAEPEDDEDHDCEGCEKIWYCNDLIDAIVELRIEIIFTFGQREPDWGKTYR